MTPHPGASKLLLLVSVLLFVLAAAGVHGGPLSSIEVAELGGAALAAALLVA